MMTVKGIEGLKSFVKANVGERNVVQVNLMIEGEDKDGLRTKTSAGTPETGGSGTVVQFGINHGLGQGS